MPKRKLRLPKILAKVHFHTIRIQNVSIAAHNYINNYGIIYNTILIINKCSVRFVKNNKHMKAKSPHNKSITNLSIKRANDKVAILY